ncbi:MAG: transcription antitermination factor NusB [Chloroflexota bacterium]
MRPKIRSFRWLHGPRIARCGLCEVLHSPATPARVAIAEWVELARTYSGDPMRRLVNGVLGRVARDLNASRR